MALGNDIAGEKPDARDGEHDGGAARDEGNSHRLPILAALPGEPRPASRREACRAAGPPAAACGSASRSEGTVEAGQDEHGDESAERRAM